jgi:hypothetical protein
LIDLGCEDEDCGADDVEEVEFAFELEADGENTLALLRVGVTGDSGGAEILRCVF